MKLRAAKSRQKRSADGVRSGSSAAKPFGDFLFEIGCEEIPAGMIAKAASELKAILERHFLTNGLLAEIASGASIETFGAPRRLTAIARNVRLKQEDVTREITGPPKSIAFDNLGEPTRAAESFASKQGIPLSKLTIVNTPKGEYVAAVQVILGRPAAQILSEALPLAIQEISWPRSMYWTGARGPRFIRPVRWIVALLDGKVIPFSFAGVQSGNRTQGHRFLGKQNVPLTGPDDYDPKLKKNFILPHPEERRKKIDAEIRTLSSRRGFHAHEDAGLLELVTYLNEYPTVIAGDFDPAFLELPDEILITVMRGHQKYFALESRNGELAPHFLAVINLAHDPKGLVRQGHERVLRARFADARFFWETDQKTKLGDYLPKLAAVTYESRLGSYKDKVERMRALARWLAEQWFSAGVTEADVAGSDRAAELAKCDLVTEMVREFTELQGVVGGLYARAQGEPDEIAWAVYDQYKPLGLDDPIPRNLTGCAVALADKLDSLVACFAVGAVPTGSSDPFALRRAALGIVKIILERQIPVSISAAVSAAARALKDHEPKIEASDAVQKQVLDFLLERARYILRERRGFAYDEINAAFAAGADDLVDAVERVSALKAIRNTKNFPPLAAAFKRIRNILEKSAGTKDRMQTGVKQELLKDAAELQLQTAAQRIGEEATRRKKEKKYRQALEKISELRPAVDFFFDKVLVMHEDENIRRNRIALLGSLLKEFSTIADFSELGAEDSRGGARAAQG
ncbi:MAG TPA: glycine--tRNA ligase subunit beta [Candidatus Acidoferrales bacterium]|nr:glycine--tRNA ligase subunit beta [Candidatus Acidoferrales bacterium]